jgi:hypothetical protein
MNEEQVSLTRIVAALKAESFDARLVVKAMLLIQLLLPEPMQLHHPLPIA